MKAIHRFEPSPSGHMRTGNGASHRFGMLLGGIGLGTLCMYFLDPQTGRRRRALLRDQCVHAQRLLAEARRVTARDLVNRSSGLWAASTRWLHDKPLDDELLGARIRAKLGRLVSHPHALSVHTRDGVVTLGGPILEREVQPLLDCVRQIPGVHDVESRLEAHEQPGKISALQGGRPRRGERFEVMQDKWSPSARLLVGTLGAGMVAHGARAGGAAGVLSVLLGGALALRAASNVETPELLGMGSDNAGIEVQKTVRVGASLPYVFAFWDDYRNFPRFMSRVREVHDLGDRRSRWVVSGPAGTRVEWTAEVTKVVPNALIEWRSEPGSQVRHHGIVRFDPDGNGGTRVHIRLRYLPPGGVLGHALASFFCADPKERDG